MRPRSLSAMAFATRQTRCGQRQGRPQTRKNRTCTRWNQYIGDFPWMSTTQMVVSHSPRQNGQCRIGDLTKFMCRVPCRHIIGYSVIWRLVRSYPQWPYRSPPWPKPENAPFARKRRLGGNSRMFSIRTAASCADKREAGAKYRFFAITRSPGSSGS